MGIQDLTAVFNARFNIDKTPGQNRSTLKNHRITCGRKTGEILKGKSLLFTPEQIQLIRDNYLIFSLDELTSVLNDVFTTCFKSSQIKAFVKNHRVTSGRTGQFKAGQKPWNTGTKGVVKPNSGNFKHGSVPVNRRPLGAERICSKDGFILVKVSERDPYTGFQTRYRHKHILVWEQVHGSIPEGHAVIFVDGNRFNCDLGNLKLVTRSELLNLNLHGYRDMEEDLKPTVMALAKLEAKAGFRIRPGRGRGK